MDSKGLGEDDPKKRNAFLFFVQKRRNDPDIQEMDSRNEQDEIFTYLRNEWEEMPVPEKQKYRSQVLAKIAEMDKDENVRKSVTADMQNTIKYLNQLVIPFDMRMKDDAIKAKFLSEKLFCKLWSHPYGQDKVAIVLFMNHYVSHEFLHIPCEIGLVAFSIKAGILGEHWTLVDPGKPPSGEGAQFRENIEKFGVREPPFQKYDRQYKRIVNEIENFLHKHILPETGQPFVVVLKASMHQIQKGMEWLYNAASRDITKVEEHWTKRMNTIEKLLIIMSMAGLENVANTEKKGLKDVVSTVSSSGSSVRSNSSYASCCSTASQFSSIPAGSYSTMGSTSRIASTLTDEKSIIMGAFLFEEQVTEYMKNLQHAQLSSLACKFHAENELKRDDSGRIIHCALSRAKRLVYLALDVVLVNYGINPVRGRHFPMEHK